MQNLNRCSFNFWRLGLLLCPWLAWASSAVAVEDPHPELTEVPERPTYAREISRIIQDNCQECHRPNAAAPFAMMNYEQVRPWANLIRNMVVDRRMPPWPADLTIGSFKNTWTLSDVEIATIARWVGHGAPRGDLSDLPTPRTYDDGWKIGTPDIVFELPQTVTVPARGVVDYQYYNVPTNFPEDVYFQKVEVKPGNPAVVHHIIVRAIDPARNRSRRDWILVAGKAPGTPPMQFPDGVAGVIPRGSILNFQMHYTVTGKPEQDRSKVGFVLSKSTPRFIAETHGAFNTQFRIPPRAQNYRVDSSYTFRREGLVLTLTPHMHIRGKSFTFTAVYPSGQRQVLLHVPRFDFNWQLTYELERPLYVVPGTQLYCVAHFDNSSRNPYNPNPNVFVGWGDQTWEEMMIGWFRFAPITPANRALVPDLWGVTGGGD